MGKSAYITARIEPTLKASAESVLQKLGVSTTDAITIFLRQVVMQRGFPFDVRIPNATTRKAIEELESGRGKRYDTIDELLKSGGGKKKKKKAA
jgi:DNA-damage-inducible protein J